MIRTIALAYSGGLDTSIIVPWLKERYNARVICVAADIGQGDELEGVRAKAIASGADECYIEDLRQEFVEQFVWPTLRAGAIYGRKYLLGTSMGRPLIARRQVEMGADLILVPSCTDTLAGYWRVRIGSQARALENQCYVVQSSTVGAAPWSPAVDVNVGAAAIYTPVDRGFPDDGVLAAGTLDAAQWVYGDVDLAAIANVRRNGQVFNYRDWPAHLRVAK